MPRGVYERQPVDRILRRCSEVDGCWQSRTVGNRGYARVMHDGRTFLAHRITFEFFRDEIPEGLVIDHLCRNRACVNPWHMEPVTSGVNSLRGVGAAAQAARRSTCPRGHAYDTVWVVNGKKRRGCLTCHRDNERRAREAGRR